MHCTMAISPASNFGKEIQGSTHSSGVARPLLVLVPVSRSWASRSFCSITSARRFRKSDSATRPTVCVLRSSSAVVFCDVKRLGVDAPEEGFDAMLVKVGRGCCDG